MAKKTEDIVYVRNLDQFAYKFKISNKVVEISNLVVNPETSNIIESGVISVTNDELKELKNNFLFAGKLAKGKFSVTDTMPLESLSADERVKAKDIEIAKVKTEATAKMKTLAEENAELKKQLEALSLESSTTKDR